MKIGNDIYYVGVNDHQVDLFEGQYVVPNGMSYNSYVIKDEKIAVMDTVDAGFTEEWLGKVAEVLDGAKPDYLVVQHMEPDHAANIENFMKAYPDTTVVANTKTFTMMENFFRGMDLEGKGLTDQAAEAADCLIRIPMCGKVESLNAAMASGILMYEAARQRRE